MLCSVYTTIAGEYCDPPFWTPIGNGAKVKDRVGPKRRMNNITTTWIDDKKGETNIYIGIIYITK